jgi:hypothetical protein
MSEETQSPMPEQATSAVPEATRAHPTVSFPLIPALLLVLVLVAAGYAFHERNVAKKLAADNSAINTSLNTTRDQVSALTAKVNAIETKPAPGGVSTTHIYRKPLTAAVSRHRIEDPRWKKMQGQLDDQGRQIESTREDLASTRTELSGSIATTHDELVLLEKKGERNYYEFDLDKANGFERQGPLSIRLRKANTKHDYADLELLVDDSKVSKKHVNVYEPVLFYPGDEKMPVEIVINSVTKNHIHGYVSAPKYRGADLQAMANSGAGNASASGDQARSDAKPSPVRQKLPMPVTTPGR